MGKRAVGILAIAIAGLLAWNIPASARAGLGGGVVFRAASAAPVSPGRRLAVRGIVTPRIAGASGERGIFVPGDRRGEGARGEVVRGAFLGGAAYLGWPYSYDDFGFPLGEGGASGPEVIVISGNQNGAPPPVPPAAAVGVDYGYAAGCHAIPNGYHCDPAWGAEGAR